MFSTTMHATPFLHLHTTPGVLLPHPVFHPLPPEPFARLILAHHVVLVKYTMPAPILPRFTYLHNTYMYLCTLAYQQMQTIREAFMPSQSYSPSSNHGNKRCGIEPESYRPSRANRSPSRSPQYQGSPRKCRAYSPNRTISGQRKPSFHTGASTRVPSACAICLGRYRHEIHKCSSGTLWSGKKAHCRRNEQGRLINPGGNVICSDWQRPFSCANSGAGHRHECSGCGKSDHGAQDCPRTQKD
jgi:hypothetical protein